MIEFIEWVLLTLATVTLTLAVARKYGVEIAIGLYASLTIIANVIAFKRVVVGSIAEMDLLAPAGVIVYASTFLITDLISEIYGKEYAKKAVIAGLLSNVTALVALYIAVNWTPAPPPIMSASELQAFNSVFALAPRIVIASIVAFVIAQTHDVYAFHFWKKLTRGKHLWLRNNASTMASQAIDTAIFITLAFYGILGIPQLLSLMIGQYIVKVIIAALDTPFMYAATFAWRAVARTEEAEIKKIE